jgi:hypothetical protein
MSPSKGSEAMVNSDTSHLSPWKSHQPILNATLAKTGICAPAKKKIMKKNRESLKKNV